MSNMNSCRVFKRNGHEPIGDREYVVYWMQTAHRLHYNYALEYAVGWANKLDKPLLIYEELASDYRWACDRFHHFYLDGMEEHRAYARSAGVNYLPYVEHRSGLNRKVYPKIMEGACCLITDEYPLFFIRERNQALAKELDLPVITVDSNGIIPLGLTDKDPYNAFFFRKVVQRNFIECFTNPPAEDPLAALKNRRKIDLAGIRKKFPGTEGGIPEDRSIFISKLPIDHRVEALAIKGTRDAALRKMEHFLADRLSEYGEMRNHPDEQKVSGLSPWLHFGKISAYEIAKAVLSHQPKRWELGNITYNNGSAGGFFNGDPGIDSFLDELITWREVGFHFAHHRADYDQFSSLPDWARGTLLDHKDDPREHIYSYDELEHARTKDPLWNAAQRQLLQEGSIHNYLRMLWGKKVIEWTPDPETALKYLIELNNKFAIDGRDPNSYSGIFWCFGRFDRAWQERPVFGKIRYMTSKSTRRKVRLKKYLERFG